MESTTVDAATKSPDSKADGYWETILNLFIAPARAFRSLAIKPRWLVPLLLCAAAGLYYEASVSKYRMEELKMSIRADPTIPADQAQKRLANIDAQRTHGVSISRLAYGASVLTLAQGVKVFGLAFVLWLALQLYSGRIRYMALVAGCSFVFMIGAVASLIRIPLIIARESTRVFLGPAVLLPSEWFGSPLFNLLDRLDLFDLWTVLLLILALPILTGMSKGKAGLTVAYLWGIWLIGGMFLGNLVGIT